MAEIPKNLFIQMIGIRTKLPMDRKSNKTPRMTVGIYILYNPLSTQDLSAYHDTP